MISECLKIDKDNKYECFIGTNYIDDVNFDNTYIVKEAEENKIRILKKNGPFIDIISTLDSGVFDIFMSSINKNTVFFIDKEIECMKRILCVINDNFKYHAIIICYSDFWLCADSILENRIVYKYNKDDNINIYHIKSLE